VQFLRYMKPNEQPAVFVHVRRFYHGIKRSAAIEVFTCRSPSCSTPPPPQLISFRSVLIVLFHLRPGPRAVPSLTHPVTSSTVGTNAFNTKFRCTVASNYTRGGWWVFGFSYFLFSCLQHNQKNFSWMD
jgi:hypothetical protein